MSSFSGKRKRNSYDAAFKLKVVYFAEKNNKSAAAREFGVNERQVRDWVLIKNELEEMPKSKKSRKTVPASFPLLENDLNEWVMELRQQGHIVTRNAIRFRALQMSKDDKYQSGQTLLDG